MAGEIKDDAAPGRGHGPEAGPELDAAVASQGPQRIASQTLRVQPGEHRFFPGEIPSAERKVDMPSRNLEGPRRELAVGSRKRYGAHVTDQRRRFRPILHGKSHADDYHLDQE
jgi:hypothetical protein